ncbi:MAG: NAD-dependent epimerase/dehydratase family protein [Candidatus Heimdallarchaeota archaeon]
MKEKDPIHDGVEQILQRLNNNAISFEDQTVLVTGGAGFLGSWICDVLVTQNARVLCVDNLASGLQSNITHLIPSETFEYINHDISEPLFLDEPIHIILHLASRASPFEFAKFPIQILKSNTLGIWIALGIARKHHARFLYTSSSEIYGDPDLKRIPTKESYYGNVNPVGPRSCYDEAKRAGEAFVIAYQIQHGIDSRIVRIFNTYGPRMRAGDIYGRVVPNFIEQALSNMPITVFGDGTQTRSFTYVTDEVEGILKAVSMPEAKHEVINLGNDAETHIIDLAEKIKKLTNSSSPIEFHPLPIDDPKRRCPDITKARTLLKWEPTTILDQGLLKTIIWYQHRTS